MPGALRQPASGARVASALLSISSDSRLKAGQPVRGARVAFALQALSSDSRLKRENIG